MKEKYTHARVRANRIGDTIGTCGRERAAFMTAMHGWGYRFLNGYWGSFVVKKSSAATRLPLANSYDVGSPSKVRQLPE